MTPKNPMAMENIMIYPMKRFATGVRAVLALALASIALVASGRPAAPAGLLVNGVSNPLAIDREATRFTWESADGGRGKRQTAYQILVASSPERLAANKAEFWDSGKVDSDRS